MRQGHCLQFKLAELPVSLKYLVLALIVLAPSHLNSGVMYGPIADDPLVDLTLVDAMTLAVKNHPSMSAKRSEVVAAKSDLSAAKLSAFPELSFSSQAIYNDENTRVLTLSQPIWAGGQIAAGIDLAEAIVEVAEGEMNSQESLIIAEAVAAFFNLAAADEKLSLYQSNIEEHERLVGVITRRSLAQTSPEIDVMLAKARLAQARSQEAQIQTNFLVAKAELEQLLGQQITSVKFGSGEGSVFDYLGRPLVELESKAVSYSPKLDVLTASVERAEANVKLVSAEGKPKIALGYEKRYGDILLGQETEQIYLGLNYQPGAGFSSAKRLSSAKSRKQTALMDRAAGEREIRRDVQILFMQHRSAEEQVKTSRELVSATAEVVSSYLRQYSVGKKSWLDALNAQRESVQARDALINFELGYFRSGIQLLALLGMIDGHGYAAKSEWNIKR